MEFLTQGDTLYTSAFQVTSPPFTEWRCVCVCEDRKEVGKSINKVYSSDTVGVCGGLGHAAPPVPPAVRVTH